MVIDALEFARLGFRGQRILNGHKNTAEFIRLCQGLPNLQKGLITWSLAGRYDQATGFAWLDIKAQGSVSLSCQRCLKPFDYELNVDNSLRLLADEAQLQSMESLESEGDGVDYEYIVADQRLDVLRLIEDELILVLPYAPKHDVCPSSEVDKILNESAKTSPFAMLKQLKKT